MSICRYIWFIALSERHTWHNKPCKSNPNTSDGLIWINHLSSLYSTSTTITSWAIVSITLVGWHSCKRILQNECSKFRIKIETRQKRAIYKQEIWNLMIDKTIIFIHFFHKLNAVGCSTSFKTSTLGVVTINCAVASGAEVNCSADDITVYQAKPS